MERNDSCPIRLREFFLSCIPAFALDLGWLLFSSLDAPVGYALRPCTCSPGTNEAWDPAYLDEVLTNQPLPATEFVPLFPALPELRGY